MADFDIGDLVRVAVRWRYNDAADIVNVLHFRIDSNGASNTTEALEDIMELTAAPYAPVVPYISEVCVHADFQLTNVTKNQVWGVFPPDPALDGAGGSDALPPQTTALLLMRTLTPRVMGRINLPPFSNVDNDDGVISPAAVADIEDMGTYLLSPHTGSNGLGMHYVVWRGGTTSATPTNRRAVPAYRIQRRRQVGRGS